ncbi:MAG TPA: hypothetical protein VFJ22_06135 [Dermatophilaceae bacterium]|nr:hypothetical protein [Dermatophilaceae bacterium]
MSTFGVVLRRVAAFGTMVFVGFGFMFAGGYAIDDPGGWAAAGIIALMVVPAALITILAARRPEQAIVLVYIGLGLLLAFTIVDAVSRLVDAPVIPMTALVLAFPVAFLGLHRPRTAGRLLLAIGAIPILGEVLVGIVRGGDGGFFLHLGGSSGAAAIPLIIFALLFFVAAAMTPAQPRAQDRPTPTGTPGRTPVPH